MDFEVNAADLGLSPEGEFLILGSIDSSSELGRIKELFSEGCGKGLLHLGLSDFRSSLHPSFLFWQSFARRFISCICKFPKDTQEFLSIPPPDEEVLQHVIETAPFMQGVEYLSNDRLAFYWREIEKAFLEELERCSGSIQDYLSKCNPRWNLIGKVCFHLAENKNNEHHPFAFLATYATQLSSSSVQYLPLKKALQEFASEKQILISLLSPVQNAAQSSPFILKLVETGKIFEPVPWTIQDAYQFLCDVPLMETAGIVVRVPNWWTSQKRPRIKAEISIGDKPQSMLGLNSLFNFDVKLAVGGVALTQEEWEQLCQGSDRLVKIKGQWVEVDRAKLNSILSQWEQVKKTARAGISMTEALRLLVGMNDPSTANDSPSEWSHVKPGQWLESVLQALKNPKGAIAELKLEGLQATLRPYQVKGVQWLFSLYQWKLNGCLADDMGLGKTIQVLSLLLVIKNGNVSRKPHLLVVPASLLGNWEKEAVRFAPSLKIAIAHSSVETYDLALADLVITTYGFVHRWEALRQIDWDLVILDEAQAVKNAYSKQAQAVKTLKGEVRLTMTGTPIENKLSDLWSLFDFLSPGLLGSSKEFTLFSKQSIHFMASVRKLVQPYILRRLKNDKSIIDDLPDKTEMKTYCSLSKLQIRLYQSEVQDLAKKLETTDTMQRRGLILASLMRFKQICNHPAQAQGFGAYIEEDSGKMMRLREICETIAEKQERMLLFTQFTEIIPALHTFLTQIFGREGLVLHGKTPVKERSKLVDIFQQPQGPPFFVLSLKAGGTGLTLTRASHVVHFDRWWNPAVENQATDRAYRIGQKHPVLVHQFICQGTMEEKIDALIDSKKNLSKDLLENAGDLLLTEISNEQLMQIVTLDIHKTLGER